MSAPVWEQFCKNEESTIAFGMALSSRLRPGDIVKITGSLGAGKTTLVRGIVEGLGGNPTDVHSPTFSLVHHYRTAAGEAIHCDFYRLPNESYLEEFGGLEFFESDSIFLVEWPERVKTFLSTTRNRALVVDLQPDAGGRMVRVSGL